MRPFALQPPQGLHSQCRESRAGLMANFQQDWQLLCLSVSLTGFSPSRDPPSLTEPSPRASLLLKTRSDFLVLFPGWRVLFPSRPREVLQILLSGNLSTKWTDLFGQCPLFLLFFLRRGKKIRKTKPVQTKKTGLELTSGAGCWVYKFER